MVRLSFAVRPPAPVLDQVAALPRPSLPEVTWRPAGRWVVTVRPLGHVPEAVHEPLVAAVRAELDGAGPLPVRFGRTVRRYRNQQLSLPVEGMDELVEAVLAASEPVVPVTHPQPLHPDLVLAQGQRVPAALAGVAVPGVWTVRELVLLADRSSPYAVKLVEVDRIVL